MRTSAYNIYCTAGCGLTLCKLEQTSGTQNLRLGATTQIQQLLSRIGFGARLLHPLCAEQVRCQGEGRLASQEYPQW